MKKKDFTPNTIKKNNDFDTIYDIKKNIRLLKQSQIDIPICYRLKPINFKYLKWDITEDAFLKLKIIVKMMNDVSTAIISVEAHTDCRGSKSSNLKLSKKRAQVVIDYLVKNGIDKTRLHGKGYGEKKLINSCNCNEINPCADEQYLENNRVEFIVVKF